MDATSGAVEAVPVGRIGWGASELLGAWISHLLLLWKGNSIAVLHMYTRICCFFVSFLWLTTSTLEEAQGWQGPALDCVHEDNLP